MKLLSGTVSGTLVGLFFLTASVAVSMAKPKIPFEVTSDPPGATVKLVKASISGDVVEQTGTTPWKIMIDDDWLHPGVLRRLESPMKIVVSKDGYITRTYMIADLQFSVIGGGESVAYFKLRGDTWHVSLYRPLEVSSSSTLERVHFGTRPLTKIISPGTIQSIVANAKEALVLVHSGTAYGTGFFVSDTGIIVTSRGVVGSNTTAMVTTSRGETFQSESVYASAGRDIALIKISGTGYPHLRLANSTGIAAGEPVVALGAPTMPICGLGIADAGILNVTAPAKETAETLAEPGVAVGAIRGRCDTKNDGTFLLTDASSYWGNTGGPLMNLHGEVVGIVTTDIVAISSAKLIAATNLPVLRDAGDVSSAQSLMYLNTDGRPFEPDDSGQVLTGGENFAVCSSDVLDTLRHQFNIVP
ncbi:MAG TPA: serine protease [Blastocatellia bacterium]